MLRDWSSTLFFFTDTSFIMKDIDPLLNNDENTSNFETNSKYKFLNQNILKTFTVTSNNKRTITSSSSLAIKYYH